MRRAVGPIAAFILAAGCTSSHSHSALPPTSSTTAGAIEPGSSTTSAGPTSPTTAPPAQPALGSAVALTKYISGTGFGVIKPATVSLGGDPTGLVSQISWQSWGGSQAIGTGTSTWVANGETVAQGTQQSVQIVAFSLGTCEGQYMYRSVAWFFPQHQESFDPAHGIDACDPAAPALEHPTSGVGFLSPSHNVSCQITDGAPYPNTQVYCQSGSPAASVTMSADGTYKPCQGTACLGNPAVGTPVLAYGHTLTLGPFRCDSETNGVTCTASGTGFRISRGGVVPA